MNPTLPMEVVQHLQRLDRSGLPKYQRLARALIEGIRRGEWQPGDRLPTEEGLVQMTSYSLGTVQRALRELADQRLVVRQQGLGSYVAGRSRELQDPWHCRFIGDDGVTILPISSQAVLRGEIGGDGPWSSHLGTGGNLMYLTRVISVNDEFLIYSRFYGNRELLRQLWEMPMEELHGANFRQLIVSQCRLPITDINRLVQLVAFDAEVAAYVNVPVGTGGLLMQASAKAGRDTGVYYQEFFIPPTRRPLQFLEFETKAA